MHPSDYTIRPAASDADLRGILSLQAANLTGTLDPAERREQGFVTLRHDLDLLREMNHPHPHIIATPHGSDEIAAYALVMLRSFRARLPLLEPMFQILERLDYRGRGLEAYRWYVMGQICVGKPHRSRGLVEGLYAAHRERMSPDFDLMITEIAGDNPRSLRAHQKAGLQVIHEYQSSDNRTWHIVALDLTSEHPLSPRASHPLS
jgi:hypothetical protein